MTPWPPRLTKVYQATKHMSERLPHEIQTSKASIPKSPQNHSKNDKNNLWLHSYPRVKGYESEVATAKIGWTTGTMALSENTVAHTLTVYHQFPSKIETFSGIPRFETHQDWWIPGLKFPPHGHSQMPRRNRATTMATRLPWLSTAGIANAAESARPRPFQGCSPKYLNAYTDKSV